ncbi:MAG: hypothetical protein ACRC1F_00525 [Metamycoplasmataceae bacterium]
MSILAKEIRLKTTKEEYLSNLCNKLENLIISSSKKLLNNVDEIILNESKGAFGFDNHSCFERIENTLGIDEISFDQKSLKYANILWEIILKIEFKNTTFSNIYYRDKIKLVSTSNGQTIFSIKDRVTLSLDFLISESKYYFISFDHSNGFTFSDEKYLIDAINIKDKNLSELFYLYKNSKSFSEKYSHLSNICKKLVFLFEEKKSKPSYDFIVSKIGRDETSIFCGKMHGYFRHTDNDSNGKESQEWAKFPENKKNKVCEETFVDLLHFLSLLRINNLLPLHI